jgi:hypothetical protein
MPIIKPGPGLPSEGPGVGQARQVTMEWSKSRSLPDGTKTESHPVFKLPLHLHDGRQIIARVHVTKNTGDIIIGVCHSGGLEVPKGEFILQPDDLESRKFYIQIMHEEYNGAKVAKVRFNAPLYIIGLNPALESVTFPNEAPRGVTLKSVGTPSVPPSSEEPPPQASTTAPKEPTLPQPSISAAAKLPSDQMKASIEELSEAEFQQALEHAKKLRGTKNE